MSTDVDVFIESFVHHEKFEFEKQYSCPETQTIDNWTVTVATYTENKVCTC